MVLSPEGKGIFRPEPTISFRYHQWKVLAVVVDTFVWKLIILLYAPQLMVSVALKSSVPATHSEQPSYVQLNENNDPTTEKH